MIELTCVNSTSCAFNTTISEFFVNILFSMTYFIPKQKFIFHRNFIHNKKMGKKINETIKI